MLISCGYGVAIDHERLAVVQRWFDEHDAPVQREEAMDDADATTPPWWETDDVSDDRDDAQERAALAAQREFVRRGIGCRVLSATYSAASVYVVVPLWRRDQYLLRTSTVRAGDDEFASIPPATVEAARAGYIAAVEPILVAAVGAAHLPEHALLVYAW